MKVCSKCRKYLDDGLFVKSDRYSSGLYPSCRKCQRQAHIETLKKRPMCCRCSCKPHEKGQPYCYECGRIIKGRSPEPRFHRNPDNKTMCSRCKKNPREKSHNYCRECKNASRREWARKHGGHWACLTPEQRKRATVRMFIDHRVHRGKLKRLPCYECGNPITEFHHLDYEPRTLNVEHLCQSCHDKKHFKGSC